MPGDLRGQFLRQRAQLGARIDVQFLTGDVVGQDRVVVPRCGALTLVRAQPPVGAVATRPGGASSTVLRTFRASAALEGAVPVAVAVAWASLAPPFETPPAGTPLVASATTVTILEAPFTLAATGLPSARPPLTARTSAPGRARTALRRRWAPLAALSATRSVEPAFPPFTARTARTAFPSIVRPPLTGLGAPVVRPLEGTAWLAVVTLTARVAVLALPATATRSTPAAGRTAGTGRSLAWATALAVSGTTRAATSAAPAAGWRIPPPVVAPPLAAVVAAAVLFRAHHVRHCS
ncbi:hypothetical protein [Actinomadura sp. 6K520]|uniref:hypothetical protein n=1 Tax=Actinomadura sp. 6K520 TaxID=2530364 RepID=UPI001404BFA7|nr:hypothetical protein [Actinomadura sp. 6K520]